MEISKEVIELNNAHKIRPSEELVIDAVNSYWEKTKNPIRAKTIAFLIGKSINSVSMPISRALKNKVIKRCGIGEYIPYSEKNMPRIRTERK